MKIEKSACQSSNRYHWVDSKVLELLVRCLRLRQADAAIPLAAMPPNNKEDGSGTAVITVAVPNVNRFSELAADGNISVKSINIFASAMFRVTEAVSVVEFPSAPALIWNDPIWRNEPLKGLPSVAL